MYSDSGFTHLDFIINMHKLGVQFDSHKSKIELFSGGGIKFYQNEYGTDLESINQIIYKVWNKDILNFKILGSYHGGKLESFLKKYKYPLINKYKTKEIIRNSDKLLENIEPGKVLRCSGYIIGNEFKNIIFLEYGEMLKDSSIPRNSIIQELGENIGSQTNYNRAFSGEMSSSTFFIHLILSFFVLGIPVFLHTFLGIISAYLGELYAIALYYSRKFVGVLPIGELPYIRIPSSLRVQAGVSHNRILVLSFAKEITYCS